MKVKTSNASYLVFDELKKRGVSDWLSFEVGWTFSFLLDGVHGTWTDLQYDLPNGKQYADFLDGGWLGPSGVPKGHLSKRQQVKDILVDKALEKRGVVVDRFPYEPPLRKFRLKEICDIIQERLLKLGIKPVIS